MSGRRALDWGLVAGLAALSATPVGPILIAAAALDAYGARVRPRGTFDAIVVAGCTVGPNGEPSAALVRRCELGGRLYLEGLAPRVVVTGGSIGGRPCEADVAAGLLEDVVPPGALVRETRSTRTSENASEAARLIGSASSVLVVTDSYHVLRCRRVFGRRFAHAEAVGGASGPTTARLRGAVREVFAIAADELFEWRAAKFVRAASS